MPAAYVGFVADHDRNRLAAYEVPITLLHDPARLELSLRLEGLETSRWAAVANDLVVGITADDRLSELRLAGVAPTHDPTADPTRPGS